MLVLSRKKGEKIIIADVITIVVVEVRGDKVRLGIEAPTEISVHRHEVHEAIQRELSQVHADRPSDGTEHGEGKMGNNPQDNVDVDLGPVPNPG